MIKYTNLLVSVLVIVMGSVGIATAQHQNCPMHQSHEEEASTATETSDHHAADHFSGVNERGDHAMGFAHTKTTHHFWLKPFGGIIDVSANDVGDTVSRDQIRGHLQHIVQKFSEGDFTLPMLIHAQTPPGVPVMKRLKAEIRYQYEETASGGRVLISTGNTEAIAAIHAFLRFQIQDHQTGDSLDSGP